MSEQNILTPEGKKNLEEELYQLENVKRAEVAARIKTAREFGDISENSEYDDAKNEQAMVESRIAEITNVLSNAQVVEPARSNKVGVGSIVEVDMSGRKQTFTIVGQAEADTAGGRIANNSPVGAALIGAKKGDEVIAIGPTGREIKLKVLNISK
jgi:transcription elongation factor GreA